jgi:hypothetical protein
LTKLPADNNIERVEWSSCPPKSPEVCVGGQVLTTLSWNNKEENSPRLELALFIMLLRQLRNLAIYIPANQRSF